ncbi:DUF4199 domain-containing protein [Mesonia ostreae]|uniref:DUF4199 domain-containing protein n=1 Tax=Mesonia ostreae TaxID=861110 RepID=A0ABU2KKJ8_9FLAO|nr:DUF4199 domain-containing protein [Mesonia ostreae]MDT0295262.1 DUF4199 domain-containing protein [Mesonia ostreae]
MKNQSIPIRFGLLIAAALIIYFLLLSLLDLHTKPIFSLFNGVITGAGIYLCIKSYYEYKGAKFKYQKGFMAGLVAGFLATFIFTLFFGIYATNFDDTFLSEILKGWQNDNNTSVAMLLFVVATMGFATSLVFTLSFMQLFKTSWNTKKTNEKIAGR